MDSKTAMLPMPVSLGACANATRRAARRGAQAGCVDATRRLILSLRRDQRRALADALVAGVDIAALLSQCECEELVAERENALNQTTEAKPVAKRNPSDVRAASMVGRLLEYCFEVNKQPVWFGGQVLRVTGDFWVDVLFDDGDELCVKVSPTTEGTAWRWSRSQQLLKENQLVRRSKCQPRHRAATNGNDQATVDAVETTKEPVPKKRRQDATTTPSSNFHGVSWNKRNRTWFAYVQHDKKRHRLGYFDDEVDAARAFDRAARRLRGDKAHGLYWQPSRCRLNFPTESEVKKANEAEALRLAEADAAAKVTRPSKFVGVCWTRTKNKWVARIQVLNEQTGSRRAQHIGYFHDEHEAARHFDQTARRLRGNEAHGGQRGPTWARLNFPTAAERRRAEARGMPAHLNCKIT